MPLSSLAFFYSYIRARQMNMMNHCDLDGRPSGANRFGRSLSSILVGKQRKEAKMKHWHLSLALICLCSTLAGATPYFRLIDIKHPQTDNSLVYAMKNGAFVGGVTDIALITHANADGSIIPASLQRLGLAPEPWVPLQVGIGGELSGNAFMHIGASANVSAFVAGSIIKMCGGLSNPTAKAIGKFMTDGLTLPGGSTLGFSAGIGIDGGFVHEGHFQSFNAMFPGRGLGQILENASAYTIGLAWQL